MRSVRSAICTSDDPVSASLRRYFSTVAALDGRFSAIVTDPSLTATLQNPTRPFRLSRLPTTRPAPAVRHALPQQQLRLSVQHSTCTLADTSAATSPQQQLRLSVQHPTAIVFADCQTLRTPSPYKLPRPPCSQMSPMLSHQHTLLAAATISCQVSPTYEQRTQQSSTHTKIIKSFSIY